MPQVMMYDEFKVKLPGRGMKGFKHNGNFQQGVQEVICRDGAFGF